jgi:cell division protein FtsL
MAVKTASKRKIKSFDVGTQDEVLNEVLSAGKTSLKYSEGQVLPYDPTLIDDEPLIIEEPYHEQGSASVASYEDVHERSVQYAKEHEDPQTRLENKKKSRRLTRRKLFETIISIILVIAIGVFVMLLLYPQTEISELARDNSNLKDQINTVKREIVNAEENANGVADMDVIRARAIALGMQDPNMNQVISLPIPNTDSLKTRINYNSDGINEDAFRDSKDALADYYAAHPDK